ncbi:MAG: hypothetical protein JXA81_10230 [Sedimentisphaerales bacterium]|nr:hypothetical protein [Sedimentisphaerales bacterium]
MWLQIIHRKHMTKSGSQTESLITECDELISIFVKSVKTAEKNKRSTSVKR